MNPLRKFSLLTCKALNYIADEIDDYIEDVRTASENKKWSKKISEEDIDPIVDMRKLLMRRAMEKYGIKTAKTPATIEDVVEGFEYFDLKNFEYPDRLVHMDLEVIDVDPSIMFKPEVKIPNRVLIDTETGEKEIVYSDDPAIFCQAKSSLDGTNFNVVLGMMDMFDFIRESVFELQYGLNEDDSAEALNSVIERIIFENEWTWNEALTAILVRDVLLQSVGGMAVTDVKGRPEDSSIYDTFRLFISSNDDTLRWAAMPYHSPSFNLTGPISKDAYGQDDYNSEWHPDKDRDFDADGNSGYDEDW